MCVVAFAINAAAAAEIVFADLVATVLVALASESCCMLLFLGQQP